MTQSIVVDHVSKTFRLQHHRTLKQMMVAKSRKQAISETFNAVNDV
jgi:ABC-2 type transport system ATP-binding protein